MSSNSPIVVTHSDSGASVSIHPFGATITSFKNGDGKETLFVSRDAITNGTKAIRGGIPICFPQFGQPDKTYPQHGFMRNNYWTLVSGSKFDNEDGAGCELEIKLGDVVNSRGGKWDVGTTLGVTCKLYVKVDSKSMTNTMTMSNTGTEDFDFQALFHTYYNVSLSSALHKDKCYVKGLAGYAAYDKFTGSKYTLGHDSVTIDCPTDRVYTPLGGKMDLNVFVAAGPDNFFSLKANGNVDGTGVPISGVVWNPHRENAEKMGDFGSDQYVDMICVEPGMLSNVPNLRGGKSATFTQIITCVNKDGK